MLVLIGATVATFWAWFALDKAETRPRYRWLWFVFGCAAGVALSMAFMVGLALLTAE